MSKEFGKARLAGPTSLEISKEPIEATILLYMEDDGDVVKLINCGVCDCDERLSKAVGAKIARWPSCKCVVNEPIEFEADIVSQLLRLYSKSCTNCLVFGPSKHNNIQRPEFLETRNKFASEVR
jgi:hypothetical protein